MHISIKEYFGDWINVIDYKELYKVMSILNTLYKSVPICPKQKDVFKAFSLCSLCNTKVVMVGQSPYPQKDIATGILFGNKSNTINLSPSLEIIKESSINFEIPHNSVIFDPTLESWAKQGILMINGALTLEMNKVDSHNMLWRPFIASLLRNMSEYTSAIVYVLFGKLAQTFKPYINEKTNYIIEVEHPAYFARKHSKMPSSVFYNINKILIGLYGIPIKWYEEY